LKLWLPFLIVLTAFLAVSYIWGFNFFRSPDQVFLQYEKAMLDYATQIRLQQEAGSRVGLNDHEIALLREMAIVELEGDMKKPNSRFPERLVRNAASLHPVCAPF